ncbi:feline leukemia virus subgroup C receptor-related protein 2-like [Schistocerca nitens]|uniref:feline leukemia virus subgroup C receptor-related protein 2-like n=1 Tax=Schistocerca nitens TaxID=7011 RepID=UPI002119679F|nr:feline leukemia virus subgroup C receptor-related protein 2-like [Schistocerca nitens]
MSIKNNYGSPTTQHAEARPHGDQPTAFKVYRRRWVILAIFILFSMCNTWQWIQYAIVGNLIQKYYNVSSYAVDWTSVIFMLAYIPFVFPASAFIKQKGLRLSIVVGAAMNAAATWLKVLAVAPDRFWLLLLAQSISAVAQVFVLSVPSTVAFVWFGAKEVSTACALGVFGNQLGVSISFLVNPLVVRDHESVEDIGWDLKVAAYAFAGGCTLVFLLALAFFQDKPKTPPSAAVAAREEVPAGEEGPDLSTMAVVRRLMRSVPFLLVVLSFSLVLLAFNAIATLLNPLILKYFPGGEAFAGRVGLLFVVSGTVGGVISGYILDKTHKFKETAVAMVVAIFVSMLVFTFTLPLRNQAVVYAVLWFMGMSAGGYFPVSMEFVAELTYPEPESTAEAFLMAVMMGTSSVGTVLYGWMVNVTGDLWANVMLNVIMFSAIVVTALIKPDLRRFKMSLATNAPEAVHMLATVGDSRKNSVKSDAHH